MGRAVMLKLQNFQRVWGTGGCTCLDIPTFTPEQPARHWYPDQAWESEGRGIPYRQTSPTRYRLHLQTQMSPPATDVTTRHRRYHQIQVSLTRYRRPDRHHPPGTDITHQIQTSPIRYRCHSLGTDVTHQVQTSPTIYIHHPLDTGTTHWM